MSRIQALAARVTELIWTASTGDLGAIQREYIRGADLNSADYDGPRPHRRAYLGGQRGKHPHIAPADGARRAALGSRA